MLVGQEAGAFTSTATSMTVSTDAAGNHTFVMNVEGTATGGPAGTVLGTITATTAEFQGGTYTADFAGYLTDGSVITGIGIGVPGLTGTYNWQLNGTAVISNGSRVAPEGVLGPASRSYNGKMYAIG